MQHIDFVLRGEHITLDALLKATGLADSGGSAKAIITAGGVQVDGRDELRRGAKLRAGQVVATHDARVRVLAAPAEAAAREAADDTAEGARPPAA